MVIRSTKKITNYFDPRYGTIGLWFVLVLVGVSRAPWVSGDTIALAQGAQALVDCARNHDFIGCPGTHQFGILQNLPAVFLSWKGISEPDVVTALALINWGVFIVASVIIFRLTKQFVYRDLLYLMLIISPVSPYMQSTFGEMLQVVVYLGFGFSILKSKNFLIFVFSVLAASTRETSFVPLVFLGIAAILATEQHSLKKIMRRVIFLVSSIACGVLTLTIFNYWKFGTWRNVPHSDPVLVARDSRTITSSFVGIWFGPGGGLFPFWFGVSAIVLFLPIRFLFFKVDLKSRLIGLCLLLALISATLTLSLWYAPFGWVAWGPRLMLPVIALSLLLVWRAFGDDLINLFQKIESNIILRLFVVGTLIFSAVPSIGFQINPSVLNEFFKPDKFCERPAIIQQDPSYYFSCLRHGTWKLNPSMWSVGLNGFTSWWHFLIPVMGFLTLFLAIRGTRIDDFENNHSSSLLKN